MSRLIYLILGLGVVVGLALWQVTHDSGVVVSVAFAATYVMLYTIGVPSPSWIYVPTVRQRLQAELGNPVFLVTPCRSGNCGNGGERIGKRHLHFAECLENRMTEVLSRMHGYLSLAEQG